jgi:hypothetical protein
MTPGDLGAYTQLRDAFSPGRLSGRMVRNQMAQQSTKRQSKIDELRAVKRAAKTEFSGIDGVTGFGIAEHTIRIYVSNLEVLHRLPKEYQGLEVDYVVAQDVAAL